MTGHPTPPAATPGIRAGQHGPLKTARRWRSSPRGGPTRGAAILALGALLSGLSASLGVSAQPAAHNDAGRVGDRVRMAGGASASHAACRVVDSELQLSYTGGCRDGWAQGQGIARGAHGAWYRGDFEHGKKSGHGVKLYANGDGYAGDWRDDRRNGEGRYEYGPQSPWRGDVYQGGWKDDKQEGRGTYIFFPSGDRFEAHWHAGQTGDTGTSTLTRRKRVYEALAPVIGHVGAPVCSVTTEGAGPDRIARGVVTDVMGDRIQVRLESPKVLQYSPDPELNPRWEVMTEWLPCPNENP